MYHTRVFINARRFERQKICARVFSKLYREIMAYYARRRFSPTYICIYVCIYRRPRLPSVIHASARVFLFSLQSFRLIRYECIIPSSSLWSELRVFQKKLCMHLGSEPKFFLFRRCIGESLRNDERRGLFTFSFLFQTISVALSIRVHPYMCLCIVTEILIETVSPCKTSIFISCITYERTLYSFEVLRL